MKRFRFCAFSLTILAIFGVAALVPAISFAAPPSPWVQQFVCDDGTTGVQSAIGCIPTGDLPGFLAFFLKWALGISGGVIMILLISTGYTLLTSAGNPEKLQAVKENMMSILMGLVMIGFSLVLLQTIGANVLKLPSF